MPCNHCGAPGDPDEKCQACGFEEGVGCDGRCSKCRKRCSGPGSIEHVHYCANHYWDSLPEEQRARDLAAMENTRKASR